MIIWFTGNSGAGKTTCAKLIQEGNSNVVHLDGDEMRTCWKLGFSLEDRNEQNMRIAKLAKVIESQGFIVVVSTICPYKNLRDVVQLICGCKFIYVYGGKKSSEEYPYEI